MGRAQLVEMARRNLAHVKAGTTDQEPDVFRVPASHYTDPGRFRIELERVWRRMPLVLALGAELREPGDYKAMDAAGVPVVLVRGDDGTPRAFVNTCGHRGAVVVAEGRGNARRFTCPYHGWTYDQEGALVGIAARKDFGEIDRACHGLPELPVAERAGLWFAVLRPGTTFDFDAFLCGYEDVLEQFGFARWSLIARREVAGPNWKIAYDGYLDLYHLPVLHKATFGTNMPNRALYDAWGPHQRVTSPNPRLLALEQRPESEWPTEDLLTGVWTIFPHVSIATFDAGGRGVLVSQLFPGETALESVTVQSYLMEREPGPEGREAVDKTFELLGYVVREEDYATGLRQQRALGTGAREHVLFGRNEGGGQRFHRWLDRLIELDDLELARAFAAAGGLRTSRQ
jgi:phenylpropionate dioxygenase-like ring-hydroxylating dioxygenase large terminal subunit